MLGALHRVSRIGLCHAAVSRVSRFLSLHHIAAGDCGVRVGCQVLEFANLGLPVAAISAVFGPLRLDSRKRQRLFREYVPWALRVGGTARPLITVYWEERWGQNTEELKAELGITDPPPARWGKPLKEAEAARARKLAGK